MNIRGTLQHNRDIVLDAILHCKKEIFKGKLIQKMIGEKLTRRQVGNGIKTLKQEGYLKRYNDSDTWVGTEKLQKLKEKK